MSRSRSVLHCCVADVVVGSACSTQSNALRRQWSVLWARYQHGLTWGSGQVSALQATAPSHSPCWLAAPRWASPQVPIDVCEQRDPKGLYKKARAGQLKGFTGACARVGTVQGRAGQAEASVLEGNVLCLIALSVGPCQPQPIWAAWRSASTLFWHLDSHSCQSACKLSRAQRVSVHCQLCFAAPPGRHR